MHTRSRSADSDAPYQSLSTRVPTSLEEPTPAAAIQADAPVEEYEDGVPVMPPLVSPRIRWIHFVLGCAVLLPWNVMITATPFFLARVKGSSVQNLFSSYLSVSFTLSNFSFLAHATASTKTTSPARTVQWATLNIASLNFLLTLSTFFTPPAGLFAAFVLLSGIAMAAAGSYLQTSVVAVASLFGPSVMQSVMSGQAAVAIVISAVQLLSATASVHTTDDLLVAAAESDAAAERSARVFFALSTLFLFCAAAANAWMTRMSAYKAVVHEPKTQRRAWTRRLSQSLGEERAFFEESEHVTVPDTKDRILEVARRNVIYEVAVAYVFVVTLSVYPPITISVRPVSPTFNPLIFSSMHFLLFNVGDFAGRYLCSFPLLLIWSSKRLLALSLARTLFIPLFLACNVNAGAPTLVNSDFLFFAILFAFGLSNGYVSSLCMMSAPSLEHNPRLKGRREDVDIAATVVSFCLVGGLVLGSVASFGVKATMCRCNPFVG
ncbi:nucleoside transporter-domain-containing protein [Vararia minispora EC-137]|uniref:Nucleoside transporter-domain-containing protein n=1 Tax=Vararia minispora EC-137 TaxID=1314806 RepID=A0ACB8QQY5_9AGAM|nr:nucleoside transporter-domain-containing protein [Vararia minispora EC-137]